MDNYILLKRSQVIRAVEASEMKNRGKPMEKVGRGGNEDFEVAELRRWKSVEIYLEQTIFGSQPYVGRALRSPDPTRKKMLLIFTPIDLVDD